MAQQPDARTPAQQPATSTQRGSRRPQRGGFQWTPRLIITLVLVVLLAIFALQNFRTVEVSLVFWEVDMPLIWALLLFGVVGAVIGLIAPRFRRR